MTRADIEQTLKSGSFNELRMLLIESHCVCGSRPLSGYYDLVTDVLDAAFERGMATGIESAHCELLTALQPGEGRLTHEGRMT